MSEGSSHAPFGPDWSAALRRGTDPELRGWLAVAQAGRREEATLRGREEDEEREAQADADEAPRRGAPGSATSG